MKDTSMMVLDDPFPFGVAPDSDITEKELTEARKQTALAQLQGAFSGKFFDICPLEWPDKYSDDCPAAQLIRGMHCAHFNEMRDDTKILLYRACLQVYRPEGITGKDFPYPALTVAEQSPTDTAEHVLSAKKRAEVKLAALIGVVIVVTFLFAVIMLSTPANHQQTAYPHSIASMRVPAPPRAIPYGESVPPPHITGPDTAPTLKEETQ